jgi:hypothetical protein
MLDPCSKRATPASSLACLWFKVDYRVALSIIPERHPLQRHRSRSSLQARKTKDQQQIGTITWPLDGVTAGDRSWPQQEWPSLKMLKISGSGEGVRLGPAVRLTPGQYYFRQLLWRGIAISLLYPPQMRPLAVDF